MATFGQAPGTGSTKQASIAPTDCNVPQAGNDGISSLSWSPTANILVSGNWDSGVRCWEVAEPAGGQIQANPKAQGKSFRCSFLYLGDDSTRSSCDLFLFFFQ